MSTPGEFDRKLALFHNNKYNFTCVQVVRDGVEMDPEYSQLTQTVDVKFEPLSDAEIQTEMIKGALSAIEQAESAHDHNMRVLQEALDKLCALPAPS